MSLNEWVKLEHLSIFLAYIGEITRYEGDLMTLKTLGGQLPSNLKCLRLVFPWGGFTCK